MKRTTYAGLVDEKYLGQEVVLKGWVQKNRNLGNLIFADLRDREGLVQLVFSHEISEEAFRIAETLKSEYVIEIVGKVVGRAENAVNPNMKTGKIEVETSKVTILNEAKTTPFSIEDDTTATDDTRLRYRYLDLRRPEMQRSLMIRNRITQTVHRYLDENHFLDIETPYLTRSTPEGARDYLVPSRVYPGHFYALPQSPQLFKQLLMGAGYDRYYQIARCFRDEDLRGDRQPEFTQIDMEMSFMTADEIREMTEGLLKAVMKETLGIEIETPIKQITWNEAMDRFGSDSLLLFVADNRKVVADSLGYLRVSIAKELDLIDNSKFAFIWVVDWPLFEYSEEFERYIAAHHPFTMPNEEDLDLLETDPHKCHAQSYDIVLNGYELGGGSIRIHRR
ncbi:aspartate--tRNA ligase, partial [Ligilactobacillus ruminis]|uniref:aspartate--tRNA ligase n=1 Tax=Ligilactobacillus ruminis TaxID=1623 RepID=UPI00325B4552